MSDKIVLEGKLYELWSEMTGCVGCAFNTVPAVCSHPDFKGITTPCITRGIFTEVKDEQCGVGNG